MAVALAEISPPIFAFDSFREAAPDVPCHSALPRKLPISAFVVANADHLTRITERPRHADIEFTTRAVL